MKKELKNALGLLALVLVLAVAAVIVVTNAGAEALPSPEASALVALSGDLKLSEAPLNIYVAECLRVDVALCGPACQGIKADLTLPYVPPSIWGVALFDGWHLVQGAWEQTGETTMRLFFWQEDVERLDGTVGIYLVVLAENEGARL